MVGWILWSFRKSLTSWRTSWWDLKCLDSTLWRILNWGIPFWMDICLMLWDITGGIINITVLLWDRESFHLIWVNLHWTLLVNIWVKEFFLTISSFADYFSMRGAYNGAFKLSEATHNYVQDSLYGGRVVGNSALMREVVEEGHIVDFDEYPRAIERIGWEMGFPIGPCEKLRTPGLMIGLFVV